jgi:hypothetical protein
VPFSAAAAALSPPSIVGWDDIHTELSVLRCVVLTSKNACAYWFASSDCTCDAWRKDM